MDLKGGVAVVTGGTGGLGRRILQKLVQAGARAAVCYRERRDEAEAVARDLQRLGGNAAPFQVDVGSPESTRSLMADVVRMFGRIDILVNDAAYNKWIPYHQLDDLRVEDWNQILMVNLTGPFLCIKAAAPLMKKQGGGRIVNVSSVAGLSPTGSSIAYAVSKAG
ncbi:MAG TPA: SDR family oxidoreductase, partial [bacterium]